MGRHWRKTCGVCQIYPGQQQSFGSGGCIANFEQRVIIGICISYTNLSKKAKGNDQKEAEKKSNLFVGSVLVYHIKIVLKVKRIQYDSGHNKIMEL
jgi:hypothetical protein